MPTMKIRNAFRNKALPLVLMTGAFVILCGVYAWATPIFEASDELWHFGMVDYIADMGELPVQDPDIATQYEQEGSQPPLYYAIGALLVRGIDRSDYAELSRMNPHARVGIPGSVGNKNIVLHDDLSPPLRGTALAVYVLRGFSVMLGVVTVSAVYMTARQLGGNGYAALAAGLTAFNPMFLFITASVNNDNLVTALNSLVIWQLVVMAWHGFNWRRSLFIAVTIMLASLSKLSGNVLVPVIVLLAAYIAWRDRDWRGFITLGVMMGGIWAVSAGWWYWRNIQLYGELFGTHMMVQVAGPRMESFTLMTLVREFEGFRVAYWGLFGGVNVLTFAPYYWVMDAVTVLAVIGLALSVYKVAPYLWRAWQRDRRWYSVRDALDAYWLLCAGMFVLIFVIASISLIAWTAQTYASQGRLLFPFVAAISPLLATGLMYWWRGEKWQFAGGLLGVYAVFALVVPFASIRPAYTPSQIVAELPPSANPVYARYGDVELVGYEIPDRRYEPGDDVPVTVYWRVLEQSERDLSAFLTAVNPGGEAIGKVDTYPGGGALRTSTWEAAGIVADTYAIPIDDDVNGQFDLRVQVGWWHYPTEDVITPTDESGTLLASVMLNAGGLAGDVPPLVDAQSPPERVVFDNRIRLDGFMIVDDNNMAIQWRALRRIDGDYTVFVQILDDAGNIVGQGDAKPPLSTRYWQRGDVITARYMITYPEPVEPGSYQVLVGWYNPDDFSRLNLPDDDDNAYELASINLPGYSPTPAAGE